MEGFSKILYEKFFMRDLLGKIVPGAQSVEISTPGAGIVK
jgi:hypothetical protein